MTEKTFICKVCGCQFTGRKKKYCGKKCASRVEKIRTTNPEFLAKARVRSIKYRDNLKKEIHYSKCEQCGCQFVKRRNQKYCTTKCRSKTYSFSRYKAEGRKPRVNVNAACRQAHECLSCGKLFQPKRAGRTMACGRECGFKISGQIQSIKRTGGRVWVRTQRNVKTVKVRDRADHPPIPSRCSRCSCGFYPIKKFQRLCSDKCKQDGKRESRRKEKSSRRALIRGCDVKEAVDPFKVFDRDGWRCQICFKKTPKFRRGTYHDKAPELDHILPLSKGGDHSYANTQCACRKCNQVKGNDVYGQMPLFST